MSPEGLFLFTLILREEDERTQVTAVYSFFLPRRGTTIDAFENSLSFKYTLLSITEKDLIACKSFSFIMVKYVTENLLF